MEIISSAVILISFYVAWNIGANDTANAMGVAIGSRIVTFRKAVILLILFVFAGAMLEGHKVMAPIGTGLITSPDGFASPFKQLPEIVLISLLCAGIFVTIATVFGLPVSTHQAVIGALTGSGIAANVFSSIAADINWAQFIAIVGSWMVSPVGAALMAFVLYRIFEIPVKNAKHPKRWQTFLGLAVLISGCYISYVMGANDVGTAVGALYATEVLSPGGASAAVWPLTLLGVVGIAVGSLTFSRNVIGTIGHGITELDFLGAFVAQLGAALSVHRFTELRLPVSTSQAIVGGVVGAGMVRGFSAVRFGQLGKIGLAWLATPTVSILFSFILTALFLLATPLDTGSLSGYTSRYQFRETQELVTKVEDAASMIESRGELVFPRFTEENARRRQREAYLFVLDEEGNMILHPDPALQGTNQIGLKDINGKPIIKGLIDAASNDQNQGWFHYQWPEPGSPAPIWKSSFVKRVTAPTGMTYVVGCGLYNTKMEREFIVTTVDAAVALIEREGSSAFPLLRDKSGPFIFLDTYVFVDSPDGTVLVNGAFPKFEGQNVMDYKDGSGNYFVRQYIQMALNEDSGWVDYLWPKPGQVVPSRKHTYVHKAQHGDEVFIVGSGAYLKQ